MRYLAIDYGSKSTGLAICDPTETVVSPFKVLPTGKDLITKIVEIVSSENVEAVVLGMPLNMDGTHGGQAQIVSDFADKLKERFSIPIFFQDERLSTFAAEKKLAETELTKKKRRSRIDAIAAAEILNAFLESESSQKSEKDNSEIGGA